MLRAGRRIRKCQRSFFNFLIRSRQTAFVLTQMLLPRRHCKEFEESIGVITVPIEPPSGRTRSTPRLAKMINSPLCRRCIAYCSLEADC